EHKLDAERIAGAVNRDDDGLRTGLAEEVPWITAVLREQRSNVPGGHQRPHGYQVESSGEVASMRMHHADSQMRRLGEPPIRSRDGLDDLEVPEVVLLWSVHTDHEQGAVLVDRYDAHTITSATR